MTSTDLGALPTLDLTSIRHLYPFHTARLSGPGGPTPSST